MPSNSPSKSEIITATATATGVDKKLVKSVLESLATQATASLRGAGEFTLPGIAKLKATKKEATVDRPGTNPFTKEPTTIKGKPASLKVRAAPVKTLKDAVAT